MISDWWKVHVCMDVRLAGLDSPMVPLSSTSLSRNIWVKCFSAARKVGRLHGCWFKWTFYHLLLNVGFDKMTKVLTELNHVGAGGGVCKIIITVVETEAMSMWEKEAGSGGRFGNLTTQWNTKWYLFRCQFISINGYQVIALVPWTVLK